MRNSFRFCFRIAITIEEPLRHSWLLVRAAGSGSHLSNASSRVNDAAF